MSMSDEITKEKQRVAEALARVDAQRERLSSQLKELEATERVVPISPTFSGFAASGPRQDSCGPMALTMVIMTVSAPSGTSRTCR